MFLRRGSRDGSSPGFTSLLRPEPRVDPLAGESSGVAVLGEGVGEEFSHLPLRPGVQFVQ